jgi:hypothetical protein
VSAWAALRRHVGPAEPSCDTHRAVLVGLVEERLAGGDLPADRATRRALDHLARCTACQRETGDMVLIVAGLRRLGSAARLAGVPGDGWPRLVERLAHMPPRRGHGRRTSLAGLVAVPLLAALLVLPSLYRETTGTAGDTPAGVLSVADAAPAPVLVPAFRAAALDRAYDETDQATVALAQPVEVAPRGSLPDGIRALWDTVRGGLPSGTTTVTAE